MTKASHQTTGVLADIAAALRAASSANLAAAVERVCESAATGYRCDFYECTCRDPADEWHCPRYGCGLTAVTDNDQIGEAKRLRYAPWVISPHLFDDPKLTADEFNLVVTYLAMEARRHRMETDQAARRRAAATPIISIIATVPDGATVPILTQSVAMTTRVLANAMLTPVRRE